MRVIKRDHRRGNLSTVHLVLLPVTFARFIACRRIEESLRQTMQKRQAAAAAAAAAAAVNYADSSRL
jgi:hypothetical protein